MPSPAARRVVVLKLLEARHNAFERHQPTPLPLVLVPWNLVGHREASQ
jgi:hypothetical protein